MLFSSSNAMDNVILRRYDSPMDWDRPKYTLLNHTADLGIVVGGSNIESLFKTAGSAMMHIMVTSAPIKETETIELTVSGEDYADLLVRWLGEILYLFVGEDRIVTNAHIDSISPFHLKALLETVPFDPSRHHPLREIKAVTYHQIEVREKADGWEARIIFDL
ncbi:MAG: archease [Thermodesulfobacteriota bacterium]|nr:archease [Thermodesulfobacteriota bacterium]